MAPSGFRLRCSEPRLCGKSRAHAGGAVKESDDCADQDNAPARTGSASALRPGFLWVPSNPRPCGKCPADGGRRERRHQEAEGGSGIPSTILRHSMRWLWRLVCFGKAFRIPCDAAPVLGVPVPGSAQGTGLLPGLGHRAGRRAQGVEALGGRGRPPVSLPQSYGTA